MIRNSCRLRARLFLLDGEIAPDSVWGRTRHQHKLVLPLTQLANLSIAQFRVFVTIIFYKATRYVTPVPRVYTADINRPPRMHRMLSPVGRYVFFPLQRHTLTRVPTGYQW